MVNIFFGKFLPFHIGHSEVIKRMLNSNSRAYVIIMAKPSEQYSLIERVKWVTETYENEIKNGRLSVIGSYIPLPDPKNDFDRLTWISLIRQIIQETGKICFYGSEPYLQQLSEVDNLASCNILPRDSELSLASKVSGTKIRNSLISNFDVLVPSVKPSLIKRIAFIGPESTGKSTISKKVAENLLLDHQPEFGREYCNLDIGSFTIKDLEYIAYQHRKQENDLAKTAQKGLLISDTDISVTRAWSKFLFNRTSPQLDKYQEEFDYDLYFVMAPFRIPWVNDGTRCMETEESRVQFHKILLNTIGEKPYEILTNSDEQTCVDYCVQTIKTRYNL